HHPGRDDSWLRRNLPYFLGLHASCGTTVCANGCAVDLRMDTRFDWSWRRWTDAPAGGTFGRFAGHPKSRCRTSSRCQRGFGRLEDHLVPAPTPFRTYPVSSRSTDL